MFSNAIVDVFSSHINVLNVQFQNTSITTQPCRPPYTANPRLPREEAASVCCVTLEGHETSLCFSVFDIRLGLPCFLVGVGT